MELHKSFNQSRFRQYADYLKSQGLSDATISRKLSSLSTFQKFLIKRKLVEPTTTEIPPSKIIEPPQATSSSQPFYRYLLFVLLFLLLSGLGYGLYTQVILKARTNLAYSTATSPVRSGRVISFQGRLTDSSGNPITSSTGILFELYTAGTGGTQVYTSSVGNSQTVVPDENGIFSVVIGRTHGTEIPSNVFSENPEIWLQIISAGETMTPRQQIATVGYAMNAETLQGLPPSASGTKNTVLVIDELGNLNLGETSPTIKSTSGTLGIEGQAVLIKATDGSGGSITINPDANGIIKLVTEGTGSTAVGGQIELTNANLATGNLIGGVINNDNRGYNFIQFRNYNVGTTQLTTRFSVDANGNVTANSLSVGSTALSTNFNADLLDGYHYNNLPYTNYQPWVANVGTSNNNISSGSTLSYAAGLGVAISMVGNTITFTNTSIGTTYNATNGLNLTAGSFGLGGTLTQNTQIGTSSFNLSFLGLGGTQGLYQSSNGNVGIGTTNPTEKLTLGGNLRLSGNNLIFGNVTGTNMGIYFNTSGDQSYFIGRDSTAWSSTPLVASSYYGWRFRTSNADALLINTAGNVGIGTTNPLYQLDMTGSLRVGGTFISVGSTNLVTNLNANYLNGISSSGFLQIGQTGSLPYVNNATNATLTRSGSGPYTLGLNLANANTWTGAQTFGNITVGGTFISVGSTNLVTNLNANYLNGYAYNNLPYQVPLSFANGVINVGNTVSLGGSLSVGTSINLNGNNLSFFGSGNLGIGTSSPTSTLDVVGTGKITTTSGTGLAVTTNDNSASSFILNNSSTGFNSSALLVRVYGASTGANYNLIDLRSDLTTKQFNVKGNGEIYMAGNVGIGTTNPLAKLDVSGNVNIGTSATIGTNLSVGGSMTAANLPVGVGTSILYVNSSGVFSKGLLQAYTAGVGISISSSNVINNIGVTSIIGTANQIFASGSTGAVTLSLPQGIGITSNVQFNNLTLGGTFVSVGSTNLVTNLNANYLNGYSYNNLPYFSTATNGLTAFNATTVGLGSSLTQNTSIGVSSFSLSFLGFNGTQSLYIGSTGNVGIGTTNPLAKLDINSPANFIGSELVTNGAFTGSAVGWTLSADAYYNGGNVVVSYNSDNSGIRQYINAESGKTYLLSFTLSGVTNTAVEYSCNNAPEDTSDCYGNVKEGHHSVAFTVSGVGVTGIELIFDNSYPPTSGSSWTIDDVSVREVSITPALAVTGYDGSKALSLGGDILNNTAIGLQSFSSNSTGSNNSVFGYNSLHYNTTGKYNSAFGVDSLYNNIDGSQNSAFGRKSLFSNTTGSFNTAIGWQSLMSNTTGSYNSTVDGLGANTTGSRNVAVGINSLGFNTTGSDNVALGGSAGSYYSSSSYNQNTVSNGSLFIGGNTRALSVGDTNEIVIGTGTVGAGSNSVVIGNNDITKTILTGNIGLGTTNPLYKLQVVGNALVSGKFGVGATSSTYAFNVSSNGNIGTNLRVGGTLVLPQGAQNNFVLTSDASGNARWTANSSAGTTYAATNGISINVGSTNVFGLGGTLTQNTKIGTSSFNFSFLGLGNTIGLSQSSNGYVGIGTSNPASPLDVNGAGNFSGQLSSASFLINAANAWNTVRAIFGGKVGIGNTSAAAFNVNTDATIGTNLTVGGSFISVGSTNLVTNLNANYLNGYTANNLPLNLQAGAGIGISGTSVGTTIYNTGVISLVGTTNQVNVSASTGNITLSLPQDIGISSAPTFSSLHIGSTAMITNLNADMLDGKHAADFLSSTSGWNLQANGAGNTLITANSTVNFVGGTGISLTKNGSSITINGTSTSFNAINGISFIDPSNLGLGGTLTQNTAIGTSSFSLSFLGLGNSQSLYLGNSGNVGIGFTAPFTKNTTVGTESNVSFNRSLSVSATGTTIVSAVGTTFSSDDIGKIILWTDGTPRTVVGVNFTSPAFAFIDSSFGTGSTLTASVYNTNFYIDSSGKVGVGTANITTMFQVNGTMSASKYTGLYENSRYFFDPANTTSYNSSLSLHGNGSLTFNAETINGVPSTILATASTRLKSFADGFGIATNIGNTGIGSTIVWNEALYVKNNGNVGIGTSNPQARLHIAAANSVITNTAGDITLNAASGSISLSSNQLINFSRTFAGSGSPISPAYSFASSINTGIYSPNNDVLGIATSGIDRLIIDNNGLTTINSTFKVTPDGYVNIGTGDTNSLAALSVMVSGTIPGLNIGVSASPTALFVNSNGNIGFGTTNPSAMLEIRDIGTSFTSEIPLAKFSYYNGRGISLLGPATNDYSSPFTFFTNNAINFRIDGSDSLTINDPGNVGIGTTSPFNKLHVQGTTGGSAGIYLNSAVPSSTSYTLYNNAGTLMWNGLAIGTSGSSLSGTTNYVSKFTTTSTLGNSVIYDNGSNVGIGTTSPANKLTITSLSGTNLVQLDTGATSFANQILFTRGAGNNSYVGPSGGNFFDIWSTENIPLRIAVGSTERFRITTNGNVGIGTTNPLSKLEAYSLGTTNFLGTEHGAISINNPYTGAANNSLDFVYSGSGSTSPVTRIGSLITATGSYLNFGTSNNYISGITNLAMSITPNGSVGIGTTNPLGPLHVETNNNAATRAVFKNTSIGTSADMGFQFINGPVGADFLVYNNNTTGQISGFNKAGGVYLRTHASAPAQRLVLATGSSAPIFFSPNDSPAMTILPSGNVGIGTTNPTAKLQVAGNILPTDNLVYDIGSSSLRWNNIWAKTLNIGSSTWSIQSPDNSRLAFFNSSVGGTETLSLRTNGNVGIGTTNPLNTLHIQGTSGGSAGIYMNNATPANTSYTLYNNGGNLYWNGTALATGAAVSGTTGYLSRFTGPSALGNATIYDDGTNIGIGTTNPTYKLEVVGSANIQGADLRVGYNSALHIDPTNSNYVKVSTDGSQNLVFAPGGNVGIGTTSPWGPAASGNLVVTGAINVGLGTSQIYTNAAQTANNSLFNFNNGTGLLIKKTGTGVGDYLAIDDSSTNPIFYVKSSGNVGIGTTSPTRALEVGNGTSSKYIRIHGGNGASSEGSALIIANNGTDVFDIGNYSSIYGGAYSNLATLYTPNNLVIPAGNVGIGTTNPTEKLQINGSIRLPIANSSDNDSPAIILASDDDFLANNGQYLTSYGFGFHNSPQSGNYAAYMSGWGGLDFYTGNTNNMILTQAGNLGIGTTNPATKLNLNGAGDTRIRINNSSNAIQLDLGTDTTSGFLATNTSHPLMFYTASTERMRIAANGNISVGGASTGGARMEVIYPLNGGGLTLTSPGYDSDSLNSGLRFHSTSNTGSQGDTVFYHNGGSGQEGLSIFGYPSNSSPGCCNLIVTFRNNGTSYFQGYVTFGSGHGDLAENYTVSGKAIRGAIVSIDETKPSSIVPSSSNHKSLLGVISTNPGAVMDVDGGFQIGADTKTEYINEKAPVALTGAVPVLVTSANGLINPGDPISISNISGFGAKMITSGQSVGKALESFSTNTCSSVSSVEAINWPNDDGKNTSKPCFVLPDGTFVGKIMAAVNPSWYDPDVYLADNGQVNITSNINDSVLASLGYTGSKNEIEAATYSITDSTGKAITTIGRYAQASIASLQAGLVNTTNLIAKNIVAESTKTKTLNTAVITPLSDITDTITIDGNASVSGTLTAKDATITGTLYAENIIGKNGSFSQLMTDKITALRDEIRASIAAVGTTDTPVASPSALLADSATWTFDTGTSQTTLNGSFSLTDNLVVGGKLAVVGDAQLSNAFITGTFTAGEIAIKDNFIETVNTALYIQPSNSGSVHLMGDTLVIAENGEVTVNGNMQVTGKFSANMLVASDIQSSKANIIDLTTTKLNVATESAETIIASSGFADLATSSAKMASNATAGSANLPAGKTEIIINNKNLTSNSIVYLTPAGSTGNQVVYLKSKFISPTPSPVASESALPAEASAAAGTKQLDSFFTIAIDQPLVKDININWWIIN